jgi:GH25 family lysozyme M1 (1,4-beta-N-acetylmuramidase)
MGMVCLCLGLLASSPTLASAERLKGFDVSQFQGTVNWATAYNQGVRFAFIRCNRGGPMGMQLTDSQFLANMAASSNVVVGGQPVSILTGNYHAGRPDTFVLPPNTTTLEQFTAAVTAHAQSEADFFYADVKPYLTPGHLRPALDLEVGGTTFPTGKFGYSMWANAFLDRFEALSGVEPIIYANTNYATNFMDSTLAGRDLWIANWSQPANSQTFSPPTGVFPAWTFWQYDSPNGLGASYGTHSTDIDLDVVNGDLTTLQSMLITVPEPVSPVSLLMLASCVLFRRYTCAR